MISHPCYAGLAALLSLAALVPPLHAEPSWQLRAMAAWGGATADTATSPGPGERLEIAGDSLDGFGLAVDYRFSERLGLSLGWLDLELDTDIRASLGGIADADRFDLGSSVWSLGLDVDLLPGRALDLVISPLLLWNDYDDPTVELPRLGIAGRFALDDEIGWGLRLRADVPLGRFLLSAGVEYHDASADVSDADIDVAIDVDPWLVTLGGGYRF